MRELWSRVRSYLPKKISKERIDTIFCVTGLKWLLKGNIKDTYAVIMVCYLLHVLEHPKKDKCFKRVNDRALTDTKGGYKYWETKVKDDHHQIWWDPYYQDTVRSH